MQNKNKTKHVKRNAQNNNNNKKHTHNKTTTTQTCFKKTEINKT